MLDFIWYVIIGFVAGTIAKLIMPGKDSGGFIMTTLLGIFGSLLATYLGRLVGLYAEGQVGGFIAAVVGAIIILGVYHLIRKKKSAG